MKTIITLLGLVSYSVGFGQSIISNNNTAVLLTPEGIEIKSDSNYNSTNLALGTGALKANKGVENTALGNGALGTIISGNNNVAVGSYSMLLNSSGENNVAVGFNAQAFNSGSRNTSLGSNAQLAITSASDIVAIGYEALKSNEVSENTALGTYSLRNNIGGEANTAVGFESLRQGNSFDFSNNTAVGYKALKGGSGYSNTALGSLAMENAGSGRFNIAIGKDAMSLHSYGDYNIALGNNALSNASVPTSGNVAIGHNAGQLNNRNNLLYIENSQAGPDFREQPLIGGNFATSSGEEFGRNVGINRSISDLLSREETLQVEGEAFKTSGGGNWVTTSDRRLKKEIEPLNSDEILKKILALQGVNYQWKDASKGSGIQYGFIAQDLQKVFPTKVQEDKNGYLSASYGDFDPFLVEAIKALYKELEAVKEQLSSVKKQLSQSQFARSN